jgi:hypothetical protein
MHGGGRDGHRQTHQWSIRAWPPVWVMTDGRELLAQIWRKDDQLRTRRQSRSRHRRSLRHRPRVRSCTGPLGRSPCACGT